MNLIVCRTAWAKTGMLKPLNTVLRQFMYFANIETFKRLICSFADNWLLYFVPTF